MARLDLATRVEVGEAHELLLEATLPLPRDHRRGGVERALELLAEHPTLSGESIWVAAAVGDEAAADRWLDQRPALACAEGGTRGWDPLLYLCFSRLLPTERGAAMRRIAKRLLELGADPNTHWVDPDHGGDPKESALYGAAGIANDPELARLLIDGGADPNDGETAYHMVEHAGVPSAESIVPKLEPFHRGIALAHQIDFDDEAGLEKLLALGCLPTDPSPFGNRPLHQAVFRGRGRRTFERLIEAGAELDRPNAQGKTAYALAARSGRAEIVQWLVEAGASSDLVPVDRFIAACAAGDLEGARAARKAFDGELDERDRAEICEAADGGNLAGVKTMLAMGWDVNERGHVWHETPTHRAAMLGHLETVRHLVEAGADLTILDRSYQASPLGWAQHGGKQEVVDYFRTLPERLDLWDAIELGHEARALELLPEVESIDAPLRGALPGVLLRLAAYHGAAGIAEALLERGADSTLATEYGHDALRVARDRGHGEIAESIASARARRNEL